MKIWSLILIFILGLSVIAPANAVNPEEVLSDPVLEKRAREISLGLRCLVCQNQSIDDSDAALAKDLRLLVRERLARGESNDEVVSYIVSRYGDFVLLKPKFGLKTLVLWGLPIALLILGIFAMFFLAKSRKQDKKNAGLTSEEEKKLAKILNNT